MKKVVEHEPRKAVLRFYAEAFDSWGEQEQLLLAEGRYAEAQGAHQMGLVVLRAYQAEADDPKP